MAEFKYLGMTVSFQNFIHEEIKSWLNLGNAIYCLVQNICIPVWCLKILKIKVQGPVVGTC
jgi:hypothetical protein